VDNVLLVVGFGNTLRCDDGVGPRVAESVELLGLPGVLTLSCHQLTPELAYPVSMAGNVVFVDAAVDDPGTLSIKRVEPTRSSLVLEHAPSPQTLLALSRDAFGRAPDAWMITVPAEVLGFGEELSPVAKRGVKKALQAIRDLHGELAARGQRQAGADPASAGTDRPHVHVRT
jgi:hydrogenase maturation protease